MTGKHPAPFTDSIIDELEYLIGLYVPCSWSIHDPFAGNGRKLGALCDRLGHKFTGVDIEAWDDADRRVMIGDSTEANSYPEPLSFAVVTSPTYNNGVNDHFKPSNTKGRLTYRARLGRPLHENNTGRYSGRGSKTAEAEYWRVTRECVKHWPDIALVNVKNSYRGPDVYPLVDLWREMLIDEYGYIVDNVEVEVPGYRNGANRERRVSHESILIAIR